MPDEIEVGGIRWLEEDGVLWWFEDGFVKQLSLPAAAVSVLWAALKAQAEIDGESAEWEGACEVCGYFAWECWICVEDGPLPPDAYETGYFHPKHDHEFECKVCALSVASRRAQAEVERLRAALAWALPLVPIPGGRIPLNAAYQVNYRKARAALQPPTASEEARA